MGERRRKDVRLWHRWGMREMVVKETILDHDRRTDRTVSKASCHLIDALVLVCFINIVCDSLRVRKSLKLLRREKRPQIFLHECRLESPFDERAHFRAGFDPTVGMGDWLEHSKFDPCHCESELFKVAFLESEEDV